LSDHLRRLQIHVHVVQVLQAWFREISHRYASASDNVLSGHPHKVVVDRLAARRPSAIAVTTWSAPFTLSPPANTPGRVVA
jgi:hypothetical protein